MIPFRTEQVFPDYFYYSSHKTRRPRTPGECQFKGANGLILYKAAFNTSRNKGALKIAGEWSTLIFS